MKPEQLQEMGVVGAGGGGFPTHVKAASRAEFLLANGAECEPLLHKDFELMCRHAGDICAGMATMAKMVGAPQAKFGIKEKNKAAIDAVAPEAAARGIELVSLGDFYPSGDEYELVYLATGRLIPAGGIPLNVGCVVNNVETLFNVHQAEKGQPVTRKFVSVTGAVKKPQSFWAPVGTTFRELIAHAGGVITQEFGLFVSGIMMGRLSFDLDDVVTKTLTGLIILPKDHYLITRKATPLEAMNRIGKSACDQCSYCTEFCPRYLLGYDVQPHKVMRTLGFTLSGKENWSQWGELCCACGLCTLYACPEDLFPKEACDQAKQTLRAAGLDTFGEVLLESEAVLITRAGTAELDGFDIFKRRIEGVLVARSYVMMDYDILAENVSQAVALTPGIESPTVSPLHREGWVAVRAMVPRAGAQRMMDELFEIGARGILLTDIHACRL